MHAILIAVFSLFSWAAVAQNSIEQADIQSAEIEQSNQPSAGTDPALDNAPMAVKEQVMRHAVATELKELFADDSSGAMIYEALFEGGASQTRLRMNQNGAPLSLEIVGIGERINEAAGARREDESQPAQAQQLESGVQARSVPDAVRQRIQQQLGEIQVENMQPKVFYQLNIRQDGNLQQIWADENGTLLTPQPQ